MWLQRHNQPLTLFSYARGLKVSLLPAFLSVWGHTNEQIGSYIKNASAYVTHLPFDVAIAYVMTLACAEGAKATYDFEPIDAADRQRLHNRFLAQGAFIGSAGALFIEAINPALHTSATDGTLPGTLVGAALAYAFNRVKKPVKRYETKRRTGNLSR